MRLEVSFICDDIRIEEGNKISLMGLYDDALLVPTLPARLAKLCLFQRWKDVRTGVKLFIELRGPALGVPSVRAEGVLLKKPDSMKSGESESATGANILMTFAPIDLGGEGELEFLTFWEDSATPNYRHRIRIGKNSGATETGR